MRHFAFAVLLSSWAQVCGAGSTGPIQVLEVGEFHGDEVPPAGDHPWFGLVPVPGGFAWRRVILSIRTVRDEIVDGPGQRSGKKVSVAGPAPEFLAQGVPSMGPAKVQTCAPVSRTAEDAARQVWQYRLDGKTYSLRWTAPTETGAGKPSQLVLESGGLSQVLYSWPDGFVEGHCRIIWAGDLDGDGRLDLYLHLSGHSNVIEHTLLLSTGRQGSDLVQKSATWTTTGC